LQHANALLVVDIFTAESEIPSSVYGSMESTPSSPSTLSQVAKGDVESANHF
jgi:hypothetical protein